MAVFQPVRRARIADQVAASVRDAILGGEYRAGDSLPPEREMAQQFGVNRSSVREAVNRLEAWGLVDVRHGGGIRVVDVLASAGLHVLPWLLAPGGRLDPGLLRDLLELRVVLLGFTAQQAARHAGPEAVADLEGALERLEAARGTAAVQEADFAFYEALVRATGNRVLSLISNALGHVYLENAELFASLYALAPLDTALHRQALAAVRERSALAARAAMEAYGRSVLPAEEPTP